MRHRSWPVLLAAVFGLCLWYRAFRGATERPGVRGGDVRAAADVDRAPDGTPLEHYAG